MAAKQVRLATWPELNGLDASLRARILSAVRSGTSAEWYADRGFIPEKGQIVVWSDRGSEGVPGVKIGDGKAYNVDLPFMDARDAAETLERHMADAVAHVTASERARWNNKVTTPDTVEGETLVLTRE